MKRLIILFLTLTLILAFSLPVYSTSDDVKSTEPKAILKDSGKMVVNGTILATVDGILVSEKPVFYNGKPMYEAAYRYNIDFERVAASSHGVFSQDADPTGSSTVYVCAIYQKRNISEYLLTNVNGYWTISDNRVTVTSSKMSCYCSSTIPLVNQTLNNINVTNNFSRNTGFTQYISTAATAWLSAKLDLNYAMGNTRTWAFSVEAQLF